MCLPSEWVRRLAITLAVVCALTSLAERSRAADFPTGNNVLGVAAGDLDHDGHMDIVACTRTSSVSVLLGDGIGSFGAPVSWDCGGGFTNHAVVCDMNNDGDMDIVVSIHPSSVPGTVSVLLGSGDGTFQPPCVHPCGVGPMEVAVAYLNDDEYLDVICPAHDDSDVWVYMNDGTGCLEEGTTYPTPSICHYVTLGDFDESGDLDFVCNSTHTNSVIMFLGDGAGGFIDNGPSPCPGPTQGVRADDFNGDGHLDVVVAMPQTGGIAVLLGDGAGSLAFLTSHPGDNKVVELSLCHADDDGVVDVIATEDDTDGVDVWLGTGDGDFSFYREYSVGSRHVNSAVADFCEDGYDDVVVGNMFLDSVSLLGGPLVTDTHYVIASGCDAPPYSSWETAAHRVQDALDVSLADHTTTVGDGTYDTASGEAFPVIVPDGVTLRSANGPSTTVLDAEGTATVVQVATGAGTSTAIEGFGITGGGTQSPASFGIRCDGGSPRILSNEVFGNFRGIYLTGAGTPYLDGNTISGNFEDGMSCYYGTSPQIVNCRFIGNWDHGAVSAHGASPEAYYCVSACNGDDAFVGHEDADWYLEHVTIAQNGGEGIHARRGSALVLNSSIVWDVILLEDTSTCDATYSNIQGGWPGTGNINSDPMFVDPNCPDPDVCLQWGSPCIDTGDPALVLDPDGTRTDMGTCYFPQLLIAELDIRPGSCPNPLNVKSNGVLPVAILGAEGLDVNTVDTQTLSLEGLPPVRWDYEDVSTPVGAGADPCECNDSGPDGYLDMTLKFRTQQVVAALGDVVHGEMRTLTLTGATLSGEAFEAVDCLRIINRGRGPEVAFALDSPEDRSDPDALSNQEITQVCLAGTWPNPFTSGISISFGLPQSAHVSLVVCDVSGRTVRTLEDSEVAAGVHSVRWDGRDDHGTPVASGVYFCRLKAGGVQQVAKLILLK